MLAKVINTSVNWDRCFHAKTVLVPCLLVCYLWLCIDFVRYACELRGLSFSFVFTVNSIKSLTEITWHSCDRKDIIIITVVLLFPITRNGDEHPPPSFTFMNKFWTIAALFITISDHTPLIILRWTSVSKYGMWKKDICCFGSIWLKTFIDTTRDRSKEHIGT